MAQVVILDFSGVYGRMRFWEHENAVWLDFKNLEGTNCYCDDEAAETITEQMRKLGADLCGENPQEMEDGQQLLRADLLNERLLKMLKGQMGVKESKEGDKQHEILRFAD